MKKMKRLSVLVAGSIAICLQLGTSIALAEEEVCLDGDTVIGIKGLVVTTDEFDTKTMDVDFRYTTGFDVYGPELDNFPFNSITGEEDAAATNIAINNALAAVSPVPVNAGQPGQDSYYIGVEGEVELGIGLIGGYGSENLSGEFWEPCSDINNCALGVSVTGAEQRFTYADLSKASGSGCDGASGPSFNITPGITGSWFDQTRSGEGFNVEIYGSTLDPQFLAYFYTYDASGNLMWLSGLAAVNGDTAIVPMTVTSGTVFGAGFDPGDVITKDWGTITFTFSSCNAGTAKYDSINFGSGKFDIKRITSVSGSTCP